ncbi:glycosyltransferase family 39 protein [Streptomyces chengbuensis]|uniref:glycosyltransferase family 39 protein n=1 Tax=Streptomyces TaxID=1883 RepID=UPI0025B2E6B2|nr:glycosyltransferase family 39 protein [Streptomyces sp. HUAS CB01]WJY51651.1 glycosyltransferase family 39 protein [Streptomyces sp. HUAS CB01]
MTAHARARRCPLFAETFDKAASTEDRSVSRPRAALHRAAPALGLFAAARLTGMVVVTLWAWHIGRSPRALLATSWDSKWYVGIAANGYGRTVYWPDGAVQSDLAFFPLYPGLIRSVTSVLPVTGGTAGLALSWAAAGVAAWGVYAVVERLYGRRLATLVVLLWALLPHAVVLSMAYTEPLLTAFAAWSLYAVVTGRWLWAGTLAGLAGLTRPNGIAVAAAVCVVAGCELFRRRGTDAGRARVWAGAALAPAGWLGYVLWVGVRKGDVLGGYFAVQSGWTSRFDLGLGSLKVIRSMVTAPTFFGFPMALVIAGAGVLLFALFVLDRPPLSLLVYTGVLVLITVGGSGFFESKPRFLLPAFPLLLPLAAALTRARPRAAITVVAALAGLSFCYGTYLTVAPTAL